MDITANPDSLELLCNLTSFIVNDSHSVLEFWIELTPGKVSVLSSLLDSGSEIECLDLRRELPIGTGAALGEAIKRSGRISSLTVGSIGTPDETAWELSQLLAVSSGPALKQLEIDHLTISDSCMSRLCSSESTRLLSLTIKYSKFDITLFSRWISSLQALESLDIREVKLLPSATETLIAALKKLPALTDLSLDWVEICEGSLRELGGSFLGKLQKLVLRENNQLGDKGVSAIVDMILASWGQRGCKLQKLNLSSDSITSAGAHKISELVTCSPHLRHLNLTRNSIADGITPKALQNCANSLRELVADQCELGPRGIASLFAPDLRALTGLSVSNNGFGDLGAAAVARFLLRHGRRTLEELWMSNNGIKEAGALELAKGLTGSYALLSIGVNGNQFGPCGTAALLDALATVSTEPMYYINFSGCEAGDCGAEAVGRLIMRRGCGWVTLNDNSIKVRGAKAIADSIGSSPVMITNLKMLKNTLGDEGITYLMNQIARKNESVRSLEVDLCDIGVKGAMAVKRAMEVQGTMESLVFKEDIDDTNVKAILDEVENVSRTEGYDELLTVGVRDLRRTRLLAGESLGESLRSLPSATRLPIGRPAFSMSSLQRISSSTSSGRPLSATARASASESPKCTHAVCNDSRVRSWPILAASNGIGLPSDAAIVRLRSAVNCEKKLRVSHSPVILRELMLSCSSAELAAAESVRISSGT